MHTSSSTRVILGPGRDRSVLNRHPWVFSGAVARVEGDPQAGEIVPLQNAEGRVMGFGFYNPRSQIRLRLLAFGPDPIPVIGDFLDARLKAAVALRTGFFDAQSTAVRWVHGEGDGLPGLVVDRYGPILVVQFHTVGMARLRSLIVDSLRRLCDPVAIVERSPASKEEGLGAVSGVLWGTFSGRVEILEQGVRHWVDVIEGQKTGLFLDQRDNRQRVAQWVARGMTQGTARHGRGAQLLNCFSYTGGFSLSAALQGAITTSVDTSVAAQTLAQDNFALNGLHTADHRFETADAFDWLHQCRERYHFVVLDPPAFVKHRPSLDKGARAYKDINRLGLRLLEAGGLLLTCSCSAHVNWDLFQKILYAAAREAERSVQVLGRYSQPIDHPFSLYHPEGEYLKTFLLRVVE